MPEPLPPYDPEIYPEYVGSHSALSAETCECYPEIVPNVRERCGADATHTVVMFSGDGVSEVAMCDECGEPDDVDDAPREWSGGVYDE